MHLREPNRLFWVWSHLPPLISNRCRAQLKPSRRFSRHASDCLSKETVHAAPEHDVVARGSSAACEASKVWRPVQPIRTVIAPKRCLTNMVRVSVPGLPKRSRAIGHHPTERGIGGPVQHLNRSVRMGYCNLILTGASQPILREVEFPLACDSLAAREYLGHAPTAHRTRTWYQIYPEAIHIYNCRRYHENQVLNDEQPT